MRSLLLQRVYNSAAQQPPAISKSIRQRALFVFRISEIRSCICRVLFNQFIFRLLVTRVEQTSEEWVICFGTKISDKRQS
jgi:hypothetical protein